MLSRRTAILATVALPWSLAALAQTLLLPPYPFPIPRAVVMPMSFAWSGPLAGAVRSLAASLGFTAWANMSSGLPMPDPPPAVPISIGFVSATPVEIVAALNRAVSSQAVVVLDPVQRSIGVVFYG